MYKVIRVNFDEYEPEKKLIELERYLNDGYVVYNVTVPHTTSGSSTSRYGSIVYILQHK